ncbi:MAG: S41 family peptidase [Bacteroidales bacterium]|nr:S41 family peptidase [Bacteroidales bacterium]
MVKSFKHILALAAAISIAVSASAQSHSYTLGKWTEIQNAILKELNRSYVDSLEVSRIERAGIDAMLEALDPYTVYVPEEEQEDFQMMLSGSYGGIGAIIYKPDVDGNVVINEPYAGSPAVKAGLQCGDEIVSIDGESTHGLTSSQSSEKMRGKPGTTVLFRVKKLRAGEYWQAGEVIAVPVVRERIVLPSIPYSGMLDDETGYILVEKFTEGVAQTMRDCARSLKKKGMKRLVIDLRGNGGGLLSEAVNMVGLFVPRGSVVVTSKGRTASSNSTYRTSNEPFDVNLPLIVMVDSGTASASEIVSGALQDYDRATVIGTRTYGKGLVQSIRSLPYDGQLKLTTAKYYTPSGRCVQAIDYSHRNEDGSVGHIPEELTHTFKTTHGRTVRDGGGITPDHIVQPRKYSRITYSIVLSGIVEEYVLDYVRKHESIPALESFHFTEYDDFVKFASGKEFDYRTSSRTAVDELREALADEGLSEAASAQLAALESALNISKEDYLRLKKEEIVPFIEEEIAVRYYYQEAGYAIRLRYDTQLQTALTLPPISW